MHAAHDPGYGFRVSKTEAGWMWTAYDAQGCALETGAAPTRAAAAACVIRVIARSHTPDGDLDGTPAPQRMAG